MKPHELIARLVQQTGRPALQIAAEMDGPSFQSTLHKFMSGNVSSPSRATAEKIARYFKLPIDSLYIEAMATAVAHERGLLNTQSNSPVARDVAGVYFVPAAVPPHLFPPATVRRMEALAPEQRQGLVAVVAAYLDAVAPVRGSAKRASR